MELLITTFTFPPARNGVSHVVGTHAYGLARRGHGVTVACGFDAARRGWQYPPGVKVVEFQCSGSGYLRSRYEGEIRRYQDFVGSFAGDAILCHCWQTWATNLAIPAFRASPACKIMVTHGVSATRLVWTPRGVFNWLCWRPYVSSMRASIQEFDHVVFLTDKRTGHSFYDRRLIERIGRPKFSVIPNGAYPEEFSDRQAKGGEFRRKHALGPEPLVLYVARYEKLKDQELALRAFLGCGHGGATLVFVGPQINEYARRVQGIWESCRRDHAAAKVLFLEKLSGQEIVEAYCAADVFLCSSRIECQPLVVLDAMAAGVPFVATDVGCISQLPGGIVAASRRDLGTQLGRVLDNPDLRSSLGRQAKEAAQREYNWPSVVDRYDALLSEVCARDRTEKGAKP